MKNSLKNILSGLALLAACIPYACKIPYITTAWKQSPLDSHDWIFLLLGFVTLAIAVMGIKRNESHRDWTAIFAMLFLAGIYAIGLRKDIHAVSIMAGVLFISATTCLLWGWECFIILLPAFLVFCLSVTSTSYWIIYFLTPLGIGSLPVKFTVTALAIAIAILQCRFHFIPKKQSAVFISTLCLLFAVVTVHKEAHIKSPPFIPDFSPCLFQINNQPITGVSLEPTPNMKQFFEGAKKVEQYNFGSNVSIGILAIELGTNVHQIHPASHCLRAGKAAIQAENLHNTDLDVFKINVTEIISTQNQIPMISWCWYSSKNFSTPNFISFRRHWNPQNEWHSYQIMTPITHNDIEKARERLRRLLAAVAAQDSSKN